MSIVERLYRSAHEHGAAEAVVHGEARLRYAELWQRVMAVRTFLRHEGIDDGARVGVLLNNSDAYVTAYYGVLAAGAVAVGLNTAARAGDFQNWLAHCDASWLFLDVTHPDAATIADACRGRLKIVTVNGSADGAYAWDDVLRGKTELSDEQAFAFPGERLAAIVYTSGTTGRPKGVMLSHGNLDANVGSILSYLGLTSSDRIVNVLPFYYSYGSSVLHTHLAVGGCVVIENNLIYPHRVVERMSAERATGFSGVPSTFALLLNRVQFDQYDLSGLRYLTQAGGAMPVSDAQRLREALPQARLFVMYGQTEATARLSYLPPERLADKAGSVGVAIPGVEIDIRNEAGASLGESEAGEIWARGENIMLGYWGDAEATGQVLKGGWLKTGDMGYRDRDGFIFIAGRRSDMIKTGAHRIHPTEIEETIAEFEGVGEVAVVGAPDEILGQVIKAFVLPKAGVVLDTLRLKAHCRDRLATYKIPKSIELVASLPKTASGKIKRHALLSNDR